MHQQKKKKKDIIASFSRPLMAGSTEICMETTINHRDRFYL
jgi:hypothetical protein